MAIEIERKFRVRDEEWRADAGRGQRLRQGYLATAEGLTVRVRSAPDSCLAWLTVKSGMNPVQRLEFEYSIPLKDAEQMLNEVCVATVDKIRYAVPYAGHQWVVDVFSGANAGLCLAEIELSRVDEGFGRPPWLGEEVTEDRRFLNVSLAHKPLEQWES